MKIQKLVISISYSTLLLGRDSSVGIANRYGLDSPGIESRWGARLSAPFPTDPGAHRTSCAISAGSLSRR